MENLRERLASEDTAREDAARRLSEVLQQRVSPTTLQLHQNRRFEDGFHYDAEVEGLRFVIAPGEIYYRGGQFSYSNGELAQLGDWKKVRSLSEVRETMDYEQRAAKTRFRSKPLDRWISSTPMIAIATAFLWMFAWIGVIFILDAFGVPEDSYRALAIIALAGAAVILALFCYSKLAYLVRAPGVGLSERDPSELSAELKPCDEVG